MASALLYPFILGERVLFLLVIGYDKIVYNPLQACLSPLVAVVPRQAAIRGKKFDIFTANGVSLARTALVVPVACCLRWGYFQLACALILLHDFLDHLDGIVAKTQKKIYGSLDDPILGAFLDAFCDKVVNVLSLWTILLLTDYSMMMSYQTVIYVSVCCFVIGYETVLGVVRVQDYYRTHYTRGAVRGGPGSASGVAAVMEGKLKEKLESVGLALLCLAMGKGNPMDTWVGVIGILCFAISLRFAHSSLTHKLKLRTNAATSNNINTVAANGTLTPSDSTNTRTTVAAVIDLSHKSEKLGHIPISGYKNGVRLAPQMSVPDFVHFGMEESDSSTSGDEDEEGRKVDKVYTVGCFDLFHRGHVNLMKNMRKLGKELIVGVHTDESIIKLKNRAPIDDTEKRMANVKKYADQVFVVSSTDPAPFLRCCVHLGEGQKALYVRGDDMPQFPGREVCEEMMPVKLLPYTQGVSATALRAQLFAGTLNGSVPHSETHPKND